MENQKEVIKAKIMELVSLCKQAECSLFLVMTEHTKNELTTDVYVAGSKNQIVEGLSNAMTTEADIKRIVVLSTLSYHLMDDNDSDDDESSIQENEAN